MRLGRYATSPTAALLAIVLAGLTAGEAAARDEAVASILRNLPSNGAAYLPPSKIEGDELAEVDSMLQRGPGLRDYSRKLVYSRKRGIAYYAGGNHCAPHRFNDVWSYALATNTWTLLFKPQFNGCRAKPAEVDRNCHMKDGIVQARDGGPCNPGHTWWGITFDERADRILWMNAGTGGADSFVKRHNLQDRSIGRKVPPLWSFDPERRRWEFIRSRGKAPKKMYGGFLVYLPDVGRSVWYGNEWTFSGMWSIASGGDRWRDMAPNGRSRGYGGNKLWPRAETIGAYSPVHRKIFAVSSQTGHAHLYDRDKNQWRLLRRGRKVSPNDIMVVFDSVNEVFLYWDGKHVLVFDPDGERWELLSPKGPAYTKRPSGYFDPRHNVLVAYDGSRIWVWRYRKRDPA